MLLAVGSECHPDYGLNRTYVQIIRAPYPRQRICADVGGGSDLFTMDAEVLTSPIEDNHDQPLGLLCVI